MTLEEKRKYVEGWCDYVFELHGCEGCIFNDDSTWCHVGTESDLDEKECDEVIEKFKQHYTDLPELIELIPTIEEEYFVSCGYCIYCDKAEHEEPCVRCKHGTPESDPNYEKTPSYYRPNGIVAPKEANEPKEDLVNHPNHYCQGGMECIDEMILVFGKATVADFCLCNVWKYRKRALLKNGQEDMDKADWYMRKYKELIESE